MDPSYLLVKLGGELIEDSQQIELIASGIRKKQQAGYGVILVHGAGAQIKTWCERLGVPVLKKYGRRVTDRETMDIMQAVVAGVVNPKLISGLRTAGVNALGLTGVDAGITTSIKRKPLTYGDETVDYGLIGEIENVDVNILKLLIANNITPAIACLTWSESEGILNINADTLARKIAAALTDSELVLLSSVDGVFDQHNQALENLGRQEWQNGVKDGWITTGMQPKLENGFAALDEGAQSVRITNPAGWNDGLGTTLSKT